MKKILVLSAAALAFAAMPAYATDTTTTYDPAGSGPGAQQRDATWALNGNAGDYCTFGDASASSGANTSITTSGGSSGGMINITQFQGPGDHANAWNASIVFQNAICNTNFSVVARSGTPHTHGLAFQGTAPADPHFAVSEDYNLNVSFGGKSGTQNSSVTSIQHQNGRTIFDNGAPTVGPLTLTLTGTADSTKYLLAGDYKDSVTVSLVPSV